MAWLKRKIVAWLLPEIQAQQASQIRAHVANALHERDREFPARMRDQLRRYG
jgi:hypothetical protein